MGVRLSVIVPVHNATAFLDRCLRSLSRSTFRDYECIVVDDASTDETAAVARRYDVTLVSLEQNGGPARARNRGAEQAHGEVLVFIDSDVCVHPDTLGRLDAHFRDHPGTDAVIGSYDDAPADRGFISQYKNLFHHYVHQQSSSEGWTFWAGCGAIRRSVFAQLGGFDESYRRPCVEDIELGFRLRAQGRRIDLDPAIQVTHLKRWTFWGLLRTDVRDRGIPWFLLMLRDRTMPPDLNVTVAHRVSVMLVFVLMALGGCLLADALAGVRMALPLSGVAGGGIVAVAGALLVLNYDFYRFYVRRRGFAFAVATVPMHWFYYAYCGVSVGVGLSVYLWGKLTPRRDPSGLPSSGALR